MNIAILASTNGTNLPQFFSDAKKLGILCILISNKQDCGALQKAKNEGIESIFINPTGKTREDFDREILQILIREKIQHIFCVGYMRIISSVLIEAFPNTIYNIHPSLLPAFAGGMDTDVHAQVIKKGCKVSGATVHIISNEVDEGPILMQKACLVEDNETAESLKQKVQILEQEMLGNMLKKII